MLKNIMPYDYIHPRGWAGVMLNTMLNRAVSSGFVLRAACNFYLKEKNAS